MERGVQQEKRAIAPRGGRAYSFVRSIVCIAYRERTALAPHGSPNVARRTHDRILPRVRDSSPAEAVSFGAAAAVKNRPERRATTAVERRVSSKTPASKEAWFRDEVIVVEDDRPLADMIAYAMESTGRSVTVYYDGVTALRELVALPDSDVRRVVLLSIDLSGIDGHTLHERLQFLRPGSFLVAFLSTRASDTDQIRALRAGAVDYIVKPVSIRLLIEKIGVWLALARG